MLKANFDELLKEFSEDQKKSISATSSKAYEQNFDHYVAILLSIPNAPPPIPPTIQSFGAFLKYKRKMGVSYSTLKAYNVAMAHYCLEHNIEDITKSKQITKWMKAMNRELLGSSFPFAANSITPQILGQISKKINCAKFIDVRDMSMFSMQFECMLRVSEIIALELGDIQFEQERYMVRIRKTKVDQSGIGRSIITYKNDKEYSSFNWLTVYLQIRMQSTNTKLFLSHGGRQLTSTDVSLRLKKWISEIKEDPTNYSTHSLRKGGAQTAAFNGAFPSAIKHQGGWKSNCFLTYTAFDEEMAGENLKNKI